jgi:NADH-quinone oxidoreductase subunit G
MNMPIITIDDKQIEVEKGTNLIQAAQQMGVEIPHYCYHPGLRVDGNCRMCLVEVKGPRGFMPQIACNTPCTDGLEIKTNTPAVKDMRKGVMEFLLHNHPIDCPICDQAGECRLQDYYMKYGNYDNRSIVEKVHKDKVVDIGPLVVLDQERCVLCSRCVRFCDDVSKTSELVITNRGAHSKIEIFPGIELENKYSGNVVDICPVGALTSKDFRFKMRVWFMSTAKSVCHGCSRGCNIDLDYKNENVYRFRPRFNLSVNDYWMCDEGRLSYKEINNNRFLEATFKGEFIEYNEAVKNFMSLVKAARATTSSNSIAAVASPFSSIEDNWLLSKFMQKVAGSELIYGADFKADGFQDDFLIRADKTPNRKGLDYLGINRNREDLIKALESGEIKLLIVMNNDIAGDGGEQIKNLLTGVEIISLDTHNNMTNSIATLAIPVSMYSEKYGTVINFEDHLQRYDKAFDTFQKEDSLAVAEWEFFANLINDFNPENKYLDIEDVWAGLREEIKAFSGITFYDLGELGINIPNKIEREAREATEALAAQQAESVAEAENKTEEIIT